MQVRGFWASFFVGFATYYSSVSLIGRFMLHSGIHHDPESRDEKLAKPKHGPVRARTRTPRLRTDLCLAFMLVHDGCPCDGCPNPQSSS